MSVCILIVADMRGSDMKLMRIRCNEAFCVLTEDQLADAYLVANDANEQCWTFSLNANSYHVHLRVLHS